jgi:hypothetical protein
LLQVRLSYLYLQKMDALALSCESEHTSIPRVLVASHPRDLAASTATFSWYHVIMLSCYHVITCTKTKSVFIQIFWIKSCYHDEKSCYHDEKSVFIQIFWRKDFRLMQISRPNQMRKQTRSKEETSRGEKILTHRTHLFLSHRILGILLPPQPRSWRWAQHVLQQEEGESQGRPCALAPIQGCRRWLVTAAEGPHATASSPQDDDSNDAPQLRQCRPRSWLLPDPP